MDRDPRRAAAISVPFRLPRHTTPHRRMRLPTLFACTALLAAPAFAQKGGSDKIIKKNGEARPGVEVIELTTTGVKFRKENPKDKSKPIEEELPAHQLLAIEWGDLPDAYISARSAFDRGDAAAAAQLFGEAERQATRPLLKVDAAFFQIKAAVGAAGTDQNAAATAADKAVAWLTANANHWRTPEALLLAGRAQRLAGKFADAATTLKDLDSRASSEQFGPVWSARAKFESAQALLDSGKPAEARIAFQAASSAADTALAAAGSKSPDATELNGLKIQAKVGEGETYLGEKQWSKAETFFNGLARGDQAELVAAGRAGEGEAIFLAAAEQKNLDGIRRAQVVLATASVFDSLGGEAAAKANFYLGKCVQMLGADREGDGWKARATNYFQIVVSSYPTSRWAGNARTELAAK